jgi:hypothetical protein
MKLWILGVFAFLLIGIVALVTACKSDNSPITTTTYSNGTGSSVTPIPTATPVPIATPKPIYYYSVYYTATCTNCILDPGSTGAVDYENSSGNMINNANTFLPFTSPTMTFQSGQWLYIFGSMSGGEIELVNIYVNGSLAYSNSGDPSAVLSESLP